MCADLTAKDVLDYLKDSYKDAHYFVPNVYFFGHPYCETDALIVRTNGILVDVEIKVSKADYFADFKKTQKHKILEFGYYTLPHDTYQKLKETDKRRTKVKAGEPIYTDRPNRFYFCVPENLIKKKDLPKYAGLLYVMKDGSIKKIKEAKLLHSERVEFDKILCRKFYFRLLNCQNN